MPETSATPPRRFVYISCAASKEIWIFAMDPGGGLRGVARAPVPGTGEPSPSSMPFAVSPNRRFLYAALRTPPFPVTSFAIGPRSGGLTPIGSATLADSMAYIVADRTGRHLLGASYPGARLTSNPIGVDGTVRASATQIVPTAPKAHSILPDRANRFVYAAVLGGDHVMQLGFDAQSGRMTPIPPDAAAEPGAGPRHLRFHPTAGLLFAINEIAGTIDSYRVDPQSGRLTRVAGMSATKERSAAAPSEAAADLHVTPDGRFLYGSVRSSSTIAGFAIDTASGELRRIGIWEAPPVPRGFAIDPDGRFLLAAGLDCARLAVFTLDPASGALSPRAQYATGGMPNWIEIVDLPPV